MREKLKSFVKSVGKPILIWILVGVVVLLALTMFMIDDDTVAAITATIIFVMSFVSVFGAIAYLIYKFAKGKVRMIFESVLLYFFVMTILEYAGGGRIVDIATKLTALMLTCALIVFAVRILFEKLSALVWIPKKSIKDFSTDNSSLDSTHDYNDMFSQPDSEYEDEEDADIKIGVDQMTGSEFEEFCAELLHTKGYCDIRIIGGAGDHGIDIIAEKDEVIWGFQCKRWGLDNHIGNEVIRDTFAGKAFYHCDIAAVITTTTFTRKAEEYAKETGILLWGRDKLDRMIPAMYET